MVIVGIGLAEALARYHMRKPLSNNNFHTTCLDAINLAQEMRGLTLQGKLWYSRPLHICLHVALPCIVVTEKDAVRCKKSISVVDNVENGVKL